MDLRTKYGFCEHHYLKDKIALSLSSLVNLLFYDTSY